ncbi:MAG: glutamate ligase domain-containing protein, partial [Terriglobia bacterium]
CSDPPWRETLDAIRPRLRRKLVTYGTGPGAAITAIDLEWRGAGSAFRVFESGRHLADFSLAVPGRHNVQNALAAVGVGLELGLSPAQMQQGLERFRGADRRFEVKAQADGITLVDDYGHHPAEIHATLDAARSRGARRIWAIFQPHRFSRTYFLTDDFAHAFAGCERVYVLDIYAAGEEPIPGVNSERLVDRMRELGCAAARYAPSEERLVREVLAEAEPELMILTIGAGSVGKISEAVAGGLMARQPSQ